MASYHGNSNTQSEPAKMEQIITEFFAKSLHIILESRCPYASSRDCSGEQVLSSPSSSSSMRPRDRWFNLAVRDCPAALANLDSCRQSNLEPLVVDVLLVQRPHNWDYLNNSPRLALDQRFYSKERFGLTWNSDSDEFGCDGSTEKIVERWVVQYESRKSGKEGGSGSKRSSSTSSHTLYKKSILLLRSLYVIVRLLPAYKIFRDLHSSGQIQTFNLIHRVCSSIEPINRGEEAEMQRFVFAPLDTSCGKLCVSVLYRSSISDASSEPSTPLTPQFIPDYVGSPMADPLKRLPSMPMPQCSPSSSPFGRRHSWSYDISSASPPLALPSPSHTCSESQASFSKYGSHIPFPISAHRPSLDTVQVHTKDMSYDEYWPSPVVSPSPSPSPSPPMYVPGSNTSKFLLRSDSAPVNVSTSKLGDIPLPSNRKHLLQSPPLKVTRPSISEVKIRSSSLQSDSTAEKLSLRKEEIGRLFEVKLLSNISPQKSFSRSSSRLSFEDNYEDSEFSGPFVVDDDDMTDPGSRTGSFDHSGHPGLQHEPRGSFPTRKSEDAAVGALVQMLKKAPPLRQDLIQSQNLLKGSRPESSCHQKVSSSNMASSGVPPIRTTADALDELRGYREMKLLLLRQQ